MTRLQMIPSMLTIRDTTILKDGDYCYSSRYRIDTSSDLILPTVNLSTAAEPSYTTVNRSVGHLTPLVMTT